MTDTKPLAATPTEYTIERVEKLADAAFVAGATGVRLGFDEVSDLIEMARLSLTLQRRVEEAEGKQWNAAVEACARKLEQSPSYPMHRLVSILRELKR